MSHRVRAWIPWVLLGLSSGLTVLSLVLLAANRSRPNAHIFDFWIDVTVIAAVCPITGAVLASRRPENRIGWIFCAIGVFVSADHLSAEYAIFALSGATPALPGGGAMAWIRSWIWVIYHSLFVFLGLLFPTGRLSSPRWRPIAWSTGMVVVLGAMGLAFAPGPVDGLGSIQNPLGLESLRFIGATAMVDLVETVLSLLALAGAASLFLRLWSARGEERLQLKWFAYAGAVAAGGAALTYVFADAVAAEWVRQAGWLLLTIGMLGLPIAVGIAVLRYRLYEIDVIINRTLVYGALSMAIAATFFGSVFVAGTLLRPFVSADSELATMAATLAITALFQPLRRRIQDSIDRRFYRHKYDAQKTLAAFTARLRNETDLQPLTNDMLRVVQETLQPTQISLWLPPPDAPPRAATSTRSAHTAT